MANRKNYIFLSILMVLIMLGGAVTLRADVSDSIQGVVKDGSGAAVVGARVVAANVQTNFTQETLSGADGAFRFLVLPVGLYKPGVTSIPTLDKSPTHVIRASAS
jgi:hypothetical protein